jgi:hypothetical protein
MSRDLISLLLDALGLGVLAAAVFLLAGLAWCLVASGLTLLVLNWRYGPQ